jgi:hypothetical protein
MLVCWLNVDPNVKLFVDDIGEYVSANYRQ